jgi:hypothetical protein
VKRRSLTLALLLPLAAAACGADESLVHVSVAADSSVTGVVQLKVAATNGSDSDVRVYPSAPLTTPMAFPATFALLLPAARAGRLDLRIDALDGSEQPVAEARTAVEIVTGARTNVSVFLQPRP